MGREEVRGVEQVDRKGGRVRRGASRREGWKGQKEEHYFFDVTEMSDNSFGVLDSG